MVRVLTILLLLSVSAFAQRIPPPENVNRNGLVGRWLVPGYQTGNGALPAKCLDASGLGNHGTTINAPNYGVIYSRTAITLDGGSQYVTTTNSPIVNTALPFTVAAWVNTTTFLALSNANRRVLSDDIDANNRFQMVLATSTNSASPNAFTFTVYKNGTETSANTPLSNNINIWYLVTMVWDGNSPLIYVNGISQTLTADSGFSGGTIDNKLHIGSRNGSPNTGFFPGSINDVRIYNRALSVSEIRAIYKGIQ